MAHQPKDGHAFELSLRPRKDDVIVCTFPKTGNTILCQMAHQIRCPGDESFEDIYDVCPFTEFLWPLGVDDVEDSSLSFNAFSPRVFKHHKYLSACYDSGKYVCTFRDPKATICSLYQMCVGSGYTKATSVDEFVEEAGILDVKWGWGANIFRYYVDQWRCRHCTNVLLIAYEDLIVNKRSHIDMLARFMGLTIETDADRDTIVRMSSRDYMIRNVRKYNESVTYARINALGRWRSPFRAASRVTSGKHHSRHHISKKLLNKLNRMWNETMTKQFGLQDYDALRRELARLHASRTV